MEALVPVENVSVGDLAVVQLTGMHAEQSGPCDSWHMTTLWCWWRRRLAPSIHSLIQKNK